MSILIQDIVTMLDDCGNREGRMTDWEITFVADVKGRLESNIWPTEKQREIIGNIWDKVTENG